MRKALLCLIVAVLGMGAASCGSSSSSGGETRAVQVDGTTDKFNAAFLKYFPHQVTVHPGDTVDFKENWTGEPHTVTMGTLVEDGLKAIQAAGPAAQQGPPPPAFAKLPSLFPQGPGDVHQNAAQPCFLSTGEPPSDPKAPCSTAQQTKSEFTGSQTYYNSGFLPEGATFQVKLSPSIKPGEYHFYCNLHGPDMSGSIVVKSKDASVPSASDVDKAAQSEKDAIVSKLLPAYNDAKAGKFPLPGIKNVDGYGTQEVQGAGLINEMIPATVPAKVGQKVAWTMLGFHTLSFGKAPIEPGKFLTKAPDGAWHLNEAAFAPAGFPPPPDQSGGGGPPPSGPPPIKTLDGGAYDGSKFLSSGGVDSNPGSLLLQYTVSFTKAGSYPFVCLVHPKMGGVVQVT
jgi:plastocyanin